MKISLYSSILFCLYCFCALISTARPAYSQNYISLSTGYFDILDDNNAADFRVEIRSNDRLPIPHLKPWLGLELTSTATLWAGGGFLLDWNIIDRIYLIPNIGVGYYAQGSCDKELGFPIQFRSQLEAAYKFKNDHRVGISFGHISNASLDNNNPGTEILNLYWHVPFK